MHDNKNIRIKISKDDKLARKIFSTKDPKEKNRCIQIIVDIFISLRKSLTNYLSAAKVITLQTRLNTQLILAWYRFYEETKERRRHKENPLYSEEWEKQCFIGYEAAEKLRNSNKDETDQNSEIQDDEMPEFARPCEYDGQSINGPNLPENYQDYMHSNVKKGKKTKKSK